MQRCTKYRAGDAETQTTFSFKRQMGCSRNLFSLKLVLRRYYWVYCCTCTHIKVCGTKQWLGNFLLIIVFSFLLKARKNWVGETRYKVGSVRTTISTWRFVPVPYRPEVPTKYRKVKCEYGCGYILAFKFINVFCEII